MPEIKGVQLPFLPPGGINGLQPPKIDVGKGLKGAPFQDIFTKELSKLKFSGHAMSRMASREIKLSGSEMERLQSAVEKAETKGSKDSLILFQDKAFIINVPNRTVITAVAKDQLSTSVITNIDSAVIA